MKFCIDPHKTYRCLIYLRTETVSTLFLPRETGRGWALDASEGAGALAGWRREEITVAP
jgi:hypothetical protein